MDNVEYSKIIAKNLRCIMLDNNRTQAQLSRDLNIPKTTLSGWMNGNRTMKIKSVDMLCDYFNVKRSDLLEDATGYYARKAAQSKHSDMESVFSALNDAGKAEVLKYMRYLLSNDAYKS